MGIEPDVRPVLTAKGQRTRGRIVAAAAALIYERGIAGTTVEAVQEAASVSASQLYHYFGDKNDLVEAVILYQAGVIVDNQVAMAIDSLEGLRRWRDMVVNLQREQGCRGGCPLGSLGGEIAEGSPHARTAVAAGFRRWRDAIEAGLRTMRDTDQLTPDADPAALALALLTALQGGLLLSQIQRGTHALEIGLDTMLAHIASYQPSSEPAGLHTV